MISRRQLLSAAAASAAAAAFLPSVRARAAADDAPAKLRIGYLHGLASDSHLWVADAIGAFKAQKLEIEAIQFVSGLEAYQALVGGSLDVVTTGAVISNFPARGQGKAFLINAEEVATAQIWAHPDSGIKSVADLKGRKIVTTRGTTAHFFLHRAFQAAGLNSLTDVEIIHQPMANAVTTFISGAAPAVSTWAPFDAVIGKGAPTAVKVIDAGQVADSSILNGWSARNDFFENSKPVLKRFVRAWAVANDALVVKPDETLALLQKTVWQNFTVEELRRQYGLVRWRKAADWAGQVKSGTIAAQLDRVTDFNVEVGAFKDPLKAAQYFDPSLFLETVSA